MFTSLTQGHFKQLETCPRKFQHGYLDQLPVHINPELRKTQEWGTRFHQVMQQRELGLSVDPILEADAELAEAVNRMVGTAPELFEAQTNRFRQSEHRRTLAFGDFLLTVVYDLLLLTPEAAQIIDWKTYLKPQKKRQLERDWQTRLYLYVLAETTNYRPDQLTMSLTGLHMLWFAAAPVTAGVVGDNVFTLVNHNNTYTLLPRDRMVKDVCMNCHGMEYSYNSIFDDELVEANFDRPPSEVLQTLELVHAFEERRTDQGNS